MECSAEVVAKLREEIVFLAQDNEEAHGAGWKLRAELAVLEREILRLKLALSVMRDKRDALAKVNQELAKEASGG